MMTPQDIRQSLRTALVYSFMAHGYSRQGALALAEIAMEPCYATIDLCARIMAQQMDDALLKIEKVVTAQKENPP